MVYEICFDAQNTKGDVVGSAIFSVATRTPMNMGTKPLTLERLCVEYARLIGISCSFAKIQNVEMKEN